MIKQIYGALERTFERLGLRYQIAKTKMQIRYLEGNVTYLDADYVFDDPSEESERKHAAEVELLNRRRMKLFEQRTHLESLLEISLNKQRTTVAAGA